MRSARFASALGAAAFLFLTAAATAQPSVPSGAYQCPGGTARRGAPPTGLGQIHIGGGGYAAPDLRGSGQYRVDDSGTILFSSGPLAGRTAQITSDRGGRVAIRFDNNGRGGNAVCPLRPGG